MTDDRRGEILFVRVSKFSPEKCADVFSRHSLRDVLDNPMLFNGTVAQTRKIEDMRELFIAATRDGMHLEQQFSGPGDAINYFHDQLCGLEHEELHVLLLNQRNRIITSVQVSKGGLASCDIYAREIVREALKYNASAAILAHNHPSGESTPSQNDIQSTRELGKAFALMGITLCDHVVVGKVQSVSMKELGLMEQRQVYEDRER